MTNNLHIRFHSLNYLNKQTFIVLSLVYIYRKFEGDIVSIVLLKLPVDVVLGTVK